MTAPFGLIWFSRINFTIISIIATLGGIVADAGGKDLAVLYAQRHWFHVRKYGIRMGHYRHNFVRPFAAHRTDHIQRPVDRHVFGTLFFQPFLAKGRPFFLLAGRCRNLTDGNHQIHQLLLVRFEKFSQFFFIPIHKTSLLSSNPQPKPELVFAVHTVRYDGIRLPAPSAAPCQNPPPHLWPNAHRNQRSNSGRLLL